MKKIVFAINPEDEYLKPFRNLKDSKFLEDAEIHFVHIFRTNTHYMDMVPYTFPSDANKVEIAISIKRILNGLKENILLNKKELMQAQVECFFHANPNERMCEYLKETKADLVVTSTKKMNTIERIFHSSFTEYLLKFSPCDLLVLRDH